MSKPDYPHFDT
jgi:hypothetical protein